MPEKIGKLIERLEKKKTAINEAASFNAAWNEIKNDDYFYGKQDSLPDITAFEVGLKAHLLKNQIRSSVYNRFDTSMLLESGIEFLSRALTLRDDGQQLSLRGVNDLLERWKADADLQVSRLNLEVGESEIRAQATYSEALGQIITDLMPHIKVSPKKMEDVRLSMDYNELLARKANIDYSKDIAASRQKIAKVSLDNIEILNDALAKRNTQPGHALNYKERIDATKKSFMQNITEAYSRLMAASEGLSVLYPNSNDPLNELNIKKFPNIVKEELNEISFADALLSWARETLFIVERITSFSHEYRLLLSMKTLGPPKVESTVNSGRYKIIIQKEDFFNLTNLRIMHVAVHIAPRKFTSTDEADIRIKNANYSGNIRLPNQGMIGSEALLLPTFYFGDARTYGESQGPSLDSSAFRNASPLGEWNITINQKAHSEQTETPVPDVWLEIIVFGVRRPGQ